MADLHQVLDRYQQALDEHDIEALLALHADDITLLWLPVGTFNGHVGVREAVEMLFTAFPDFRRTTDSLAVHGDSATIEWRASGTFTGGPFDGFEPTGKAGEVVGAEVLSFAEDGRITTVHTYWDGMQMARELGLLPDEHSVLDRGLHGALNVMTRARRVIRL